MGRSQTPQAILVRGKRDPIFITRAERYIPQLVAQGWRLLIKDTDLAPTTSAQGDGDTGEAQFD